MQNSFKIMLRLNYVLHYLYRGFNLKLFSWGRLLKSKFFALAFSAGILIEQNCQSCNSFGHIWSFTLLFFSKWWLDFFHQSLNQQPDTRGVGLEQENPRCFSFSHNLDAPNLPKTCWWFRRILIIKLFLIHTYLLDFLH